MADIILGPAYPWMDAPEPLRIKELPKYTDFLINRTEADIYNTRIKEMIDIKIEPLYKRNDWD